MRRPGELLRLAAARVCAKRTMERVIDPAVADLQTEYEEAVRAQRWRRAEWIRICGYFALWRTVGLHTLQSSGRALWNCTADDGWMLARTIGYSLTAFAGVTLLLAAGPMAGVYWRIHNFKLAVLLLPQAVALSIPIGLSLGIACSMHDDPLRARTIRRVLSVATAATLLSFAAMRFIPDANQAFRVALAEELGGRRITYSLPRGINELSLSELLSKSQEYDVGGFPEKARAFKRNYHIRFAIPAAAFVLGFFALATGGILRSRIRRVAATIIAVALYWAALALIESNSSLLPAVSVWSPNIAFTAISLALLKILSVRLQHRCTTE